MEKQKDGLFQLDNGNWGYRIKCKIRGEKVDIKKIKDLDGNYMSTRQDAKVAQARHFSYLNSNETKRKQISYTYDDVWKYYISLDLVGKKEKELGTIVRQESLWFNHVYPAFGNSNVRDVTTYDIQSFLNDLYYRKHYSISYVEGFVKFFYLLIGIAYRMHALTLDEYEDLCVHKISRIHTPVVENKDIDDVDCVEIYQEEQIKQLDEYFEGTNLEIAYRLAMYCGLRVGEVFGLTWDNVDLRNGFIRITRQLKYDSKKKCWYFGKLKTRSSKRIIYLPLELSECLKKEKLRQERLQKQYPLMYKNNTNWEIEDRRGQFHEWIDASLLVNKKEDGEILTLNSPKYHTKNASGILDYRVHFHAFRHTFISRLARSGCNKKLLMDISGHTKFETVEKYYEGVFDSSKNEAREIMNNMYEHNDFNRIVDKAA